jgi:hypothetical protein
MRRWCLSGKSRGDVSGYGSESATAFGVIRQSSQGFEAGNGFAKTRH